MSAQRPVAGLAMKSPETGNPALTPAQTIAEVARRLPFRPGRLAWWLGVSPNTVRRWLNQAAADDGAPTGGPCLVPTPERVQAARLLLVVHRTCPAMLEHLRVGFWEGFAGIVGAPLRLAGQPARAELVVRDGADDPEGT